MKTIFDAKFNKIEKNVEKIHSYFKKSFVENENPGNQIQLKISKEINQNDENLNENEKSLSLNFEKDKRIDLKCEFTPKIIKEVHSFNLSFLFIINEQLGIPEGNEIQKKDENKSVLTLNEIQMELNGKNSNNNSSNFLI